MDKPSNTALRQKVKPSLDEIRLLRAAGLSYAKIGAQLGFDRDVIRRTWLNIHGFASTHSIIDPLCGRDPYRDGESPRARAFRRFPIRFRPEEK